MAGDIVVDYNALPRPTRERLVDCTSVKPTLAPLFKDPSATETALAGWVLLAFFCGLILLMVASNGFGQLDSYALTIHSPPAIVGYCILAFLLCASVLGVAFQHRRRKAMPFRPGRYLFPLDFVDARNRQLRIVSLSELANFNAVHHHTNRVYSHTAFTFLFKNGRREHFTVHGKTQAEGQFQRLQQARAAFGKALEEQDVAAVRYFDVFFDVRAQGGFEALTAQPPAEANEGPRILELPRLLQKRWLVALAVGVVLGSSTWLVRNLLSDQAAFSAAKEESTGKLLSVYAQRGWLHVPEAMELGMRTNFSACEQHETEQCWKDFLSRWLEAPQAKDVQENRLPRAALKEAANTVSAVREFRKRYPNSTVDAEAKARIHELFGQAMDKFQKQASTDNPELVPFVGKLLAHLEATENPQVLVRFRREESSSLQRADRLLSEAATMDLKPMATASPYFDDAHTRPLEKNISQALSTAFKQIFPTDLLALEQGPTLPESQSDSSQLVPEIDIVYTVGWSGAAYRSQEGGRQFVGIEFNFDTEMSVPKEKPLHFSMTVNPPDHFSVQYSRYAGKLRDAYGDRGPDDGLVYEVMALRAFDELGGKLGQVFFRSDSEAFKAGGLGSEKDGEASAAPAPQAKKAAPKKGSRQKKALGAATPP